MVPLFDCLFKAFATSLNQPHQNEHFKSSESKNASVLSPGLHVVANLPDQTTEPQI